MGIDISQSYSKELMLALGVIFLIAPTLFTVLRLVAKNLGPKGIGADDWLAVAAWVFSTACSICLLIAAVDGELAQNQQLYLDGQPVVNDSLFLTYEKTKFAVNMLVVLGLGLSKLSILVLYIDVFPIRTFKLICYTVMALVTIWSISFFFANLLTCVPVTPLVEAFYGNKCLDSLALWLSGVITDVILDFIILVLPLPLISTLKLRWLQKVGVAGLFIVGTGVCTISVVRTLVYFQIGPVYTQHSNDETYYTSPIFFWAIIELGIAVICAALPVLRPLWLYFYPRPGQTSATRYSGYRKSNNSMRRLSKLAALYRIRRGHSYLDSRTEENEGLELTQGTQTTIERSTNGDPAPQTGMTGSAPSTILVERTVKQTSEPSGKNCM